MNNDSACQSVDIEKLIEKINWNPNTSQLRKCSGFYMTFNGRAYEKNKFEIGCFHQFGNSFERFKSGAGNYTTAIVELPDGRLVEAVVDSVKFLE